MLHFDPSHKRGAMCLSTTDRSHAAQAVQLDHMDGDFTIEVEGLTEN